MESNIYYHSECDFQLKNDKSITKWLKDAISTEDKELGKSITYSVTMIISLKKTKSICNTIHLQT